MKRKEEIENKLRILCDSLKLLHREAVLSSENMDFENEKFIKKNIEQALDEVKNLTLEYLKLTKETFN